MPKAAPLRIGIIGLGIGRFHASFFAAQPGVEIAAVADRSGRRLPGPLEDFAAHHGAMAYHSGEEMLENESLDAVAICSAPASHRPLVERAAARSINVLLEKPMAWTVADCEAIERVCDRAGILLTVNFPMRHLSPVETLKTLLDAGEFGTPAMVSAEYVMGPRPAEHWVWSGGGGPIAENTCHAVDLLEYLFGPIEEVSARGMNALGAGQPQPDCIVASLRFRSGMIGVMSGGAIATTELGVSPRLSLYATDGQAWMEGLHHTFTTLRWAQRGGAAREHRADIEPVQPAMLQAFDRYPLFEGSLAQFLKDLRSGHTAGTTSREGRQVVAICEAILRSAATGSAVRIDGLSREPATAAAM